MIYDVNELFEIVDFQNIYFLFCNSVGAFKGRTFCAAGTLGSIFNFLITRGWQDKNFFCLPGIDFSL